MKSLKPKLVIGGSVALVYTLSWVFPPACVVVGLGLIVWLDRHLAANGGKL